MILKLGGSHLTISDEGESESLFGGVLSLEHQLDLQKSLGINLGFHTKSGSVINGAIELKANLSIWVIEPEYRWYSKSVTDGFFLGIAPTLNIINVTVESKGKTFEDARFGLGLKTGYQIKLTPKLNFQFGAGAGMLLPGNDTNAAMRFNLSLLAGYQF